MKGFKKDGKFRPTGNKTKSSLKKSDIRKKQTVQYHTPDRDTKFYGDMKVAKQKAGVLREEINEEQPKIIEMLKHQKGYHEDASNSIDEIINTIENTNHVGNPLPPEYMHVDMEYNIDDLIRDWSSIDSGGYNHSGNMQNELIAGDMASLRNFVNKVEEYQKAYSEYN